MRAAQRIRLPRPLKKSEPVVRQLYNFTPAEWRAVDAVTWLLSDRAGCELLANIAGPLRVAPCDPAIAVARDCIAVRRNPEWAKRHGEVWLGVTDEQAESLAVAIAAALEGT